MAELLSFENFANPGVLLFLQAVLGLFILLIVGIVLLGEGGHEAHLRLFGFEVEPMSKATFYFSIAVLVAVDILQSGYQKKLDLRRATGV